MFVCVRACVGVLCVDAGCTVNSALSDFVSGFLTHVLMAIKDFSLFGIYSFLFFLFCFYPLISLYSIRLATNHLEPLLRKVNLVNKVKAVNTEHGC